MCSPVNFMPSFLTVDPRNDILMRSAILLLRARSRFSYFSDSKHNINIKFKIICLLFHCRFSESRPPASVSVSWLTFAIDSSSSPLISFSEDFFRPFTSSRAETSLL
uniref:S.cerevisiae PRP21, SPP91, CDC6, NUC1, CRY2 and S24 genes n=1 Tax=Saccharomyces cerevisiae TaxID=4932 RepID=A2NXN0_YEASX|nr:unnamed protein product [Saccharomyces cerevisiae]